MISIVFIACNKDEDILVDNEENQIPSKVLCYEVIEYTPAPGQFINDVASGLNEVMTPAQAKEWATKRLEDNSYVSLGSWGGYIIVKFNEKVVNSVGYDFSVSSNTFDTSSEPGIVWVMQDLNGNGLPDDVWYELKGSYFGQPGYERNYWVTYSRPLAGEDTPWEDSNGETGFVEWMGRYHSQPYYYPQWIDADSYTLYGSRLPFRAIQDPVTGQWTNESFEWGYADNFGTDFFKKEYKNYFRVSDAVSEDNQPVNLPSIDFVKVQTAVNGGAGLLGENSTEVTGFYVE